jgi:hypothetical protein
MWIKPRSKKIMTEKSIRISDKTKTKIPL